MPTKEAAKRLHVAEKTIINTYRKHIFQKLGLKNNVELIHYALRYHLLDE